MLWKRDDTYFNINPIDHINYFFHFLALFPKPINDNARLTIFAFKPIIINTASPSRILLTKPPLPTVFLGCRDSFTCQLSTTQGQFPVGFVLLKGYVQKTAKYRVIICCCAPYCFQMRFMRDKET